MQRRIKPHSAREARRAGKQTKNQAMLAGWASEPHPAPRRVQEYQHTLSSRAALDAAFMGGGKRAQDSTAAPLAWLLGKLAGQ